MSLPESLIAIAIACVALLFSLVVLNGLARFLDRKQQTVRALMRENTDRVVFLFDDTDLLDATAAGRDLLRSKANGATDWDRFIAFFGPQFPHLRDRLASLSEDGRITLTNGSVRIEAEYWDGLARLSYHDDGNRRSQAAEAAALASLTDELETLRALAEDAPQLVWKQDDTGAITWANKAYVDLADARSPKREVQVWPPARLFTDLATPADIGARAITRTSLDNNWFEVTTALRGTETIHFGVDITAIIRAEETQRSHVQTLVKTFAGLSSGLAIFDAARRLVIFNPALQEMTGLSVEFLCGKPTLHAMLDRMREMRMIPEPKNYVEWREKLSALEARAIDGSYSENWALPDGQTLRVTGRPHPDGAIAFVFEDISSDVSLTRRFRAQIDTSQAVFDMMDDAIAVFSDAGTLVLTNDPYQNLWDFDAEAVIGTSLIEESRKWQNRAVPSGVWGQMREQIINGQQRGGWQDQVRLLNGRSVICHVSPMPNGATLVRFELVAEQFAEFSPALLAAHA